MKDEKLLVNKLLIIYTLVSLFYGALIFWIQGDVVYDYIKLIVGTIYLLYLPGYYTLINFSEFNNLDGIERFALSICISLVIVPVLGFLLGFLRIGLDIFTLYSLVLLYSYINISVFVLRLKYIKYNELY